MASMLKDNEKVVVEIGPGKRWALYKENRLTGEMRGFIDGSIGFVHVVSDKNDRFKFNVYVYKDISIY